MRSRCIVTRSVCVIEDEKNCETFYKDEHKTNINQSSAKNDFNKLYLGDDL